MLLVHIPAIVPRERKSTHTYWGTRVGLELGLKIKWQITSLLCNKNQLEMDEFHPNPANRHSTEKHNTYQLFYIESIPPDDGLQIFPKYVEVDWRNNLRINSASSWFLLHRCIEMHGQQNIKFNLPCFKWNLGNATHTCFCTKWNIRALEQNEEWYINVNQALRH
jgi:hypothetical protein